MARIIFDIETDGLLDTLTCVHCCAFKFLDDWGVWAAGDRILVSKEGVRPSYLVKHKHNTAVMEEDVSHALTHFFEMFSSDDIIIAHNALGFDIPALKQVYPHFKTKAKIRDSLIVCPLRWPDVKALDFATQEKQQKINPKFKFPAEYFGKHSLGAWGYRLGEKKDDIAYILGKDWYKQNSKILGEYNIQDVEVLAKLWMGIEKRLPSPESIVLEHRFYLLVNKQIQHGIHFDKPKAEKLYIELAAKKQALIESLQGAYKPKLLPGEVIKRTKPMKLVKNRVCPTYYAPEATFSKLYYQEFNPSSSDCIAVWLIKDFGWTPEEFTKEKWPDHIKEWIGYEFKPKLDGDTIELLTVPGAEQLIEFLMIRKRIGQLNDGKQAWLKWVTEDGRIHGKVNSNGTATARCTHNNPNLGQVPALKAVYGQECRELFGCGS